MNWNPVVLALAMISAASAVESPGQSAKAEHDLFAQVQAKADKGDAEAQFQLGTFYADGTGVAQSPGKAAKWYRKAAEQGLAKAQHQLGQDYANGTGVRVDAIEAVKWYRKAAEQGLVDAQLDLGRAYEHGRGVVPNAVEAVRWFRKAAGQASAAGKYELGRSYFEGAGVTKDTAVGLDWVRQAAEQGYPLAEFRLGQCYQRGEGVAKDLVEAYKWFNLAAAQDEDNAPDIRVSMAQVEAGLTKEQVAEAQRLALEFKPVSSPSTKDGTPESAGPRTGSVNVRADDDRSEVFVDGAFVGNPPAVLKLSEGAHVVEVKQAGFKPYRREIRVSAGAELNLRVTLEKE